MSSTSPHDLLGSVAAAATLQFSVDFDPSRADLKPSILLLTQNIGGIEASLGTCVDPDDAFLKGPRLSVPEVAGDTSTTPVSKSSVFRAASSIQMADDIDAELGVPPVVRQQVAEFLADLRQWIHRLSYVSAAVRAAEATEGVPAAPTLAMNGAPSSLPASPPLSSASISGVGANTDAYMRSYTPSARPPLVDVVVLHFQEIGGKCKNRHFNEYFKEQIRATLLPEAGWTSGLLMDERECGDTESIRSYRRRTETLEGEQVPALNGSDPNHSGNTNGHGGCAADAYRLTDANGFDTDTVSELNDHADAFFTAIGSIVFLSPRVMGIASCLSVPHRTYIPIVDDPLTYVGEAGRLFHSGKFSEAGRSRKGFVLISLRLGTVQLNVCNVHLFNDDDNRVALASSPSRYAARRARAMKETIAECSAVVDLSEPLFIFGDFNMRMDGKSLLGWVEEKLQITVRPEKKRLRCPEHFWKLFSDPVMLQELRARFDSEPQHLMDEVALLSGVELAEMPVHFAPTYSRVPYRTRTAAAATAADATGVREAEAMTDAQRQMSSPKGFPGRADAICAVDQEQVEATAATLPSLVRSPCSSLPPPPPPSPPPVNVPLKHLTASLRRHNFCHGRLPAWCDRVFFNVAGLEWIAGDCIRSAQPKPQAASPVSSAPTAASGTGLRKTIDRRDQSHWYTYAATDFIHTDHDGVYFLF
ncbi:hypothetical protein JKF63_07046 [Porcisia hertigi]|uniref:Inositol-polyphosphate 5-phosphatase n=1 Tax=Porcisia hertigi TaxID=2761500 RepID=A0A836IQC8_9TRYP|nr:hypothetical protein JKF63_07046 [Porcisia hertigi]